MTTEAGFIEIAFEELAHLASAFADQRDHVHVGLGVRRHHAQQGGFADPAAGENAEALAASAGAERVDGLDAGFEDLVDALAFERVRREQMQAHRLLGDDRTETVERLAQTIQNAPFERGSNGGAHGHAGGEDFAAGVDTPQFAQRHQEQMFVSESHHFGEGCAVVPHGVDAADFADAGDGSFGLDDQSDDLGDAAAGLGHACLAQTPERRIKRMGRRVDGGIHIERDCRI